MIAPSDSENISPSPGKKKRLKKKKTRKANKLQSEYEQQSASAAGGTDGVSELENQLNAIQSKIGGNSISKVEVKQQPLPIKDAVTSKVEVNAKPINVNNNIRNDIEIGGNAKEDDDEQSVVNPFAIENKMIQGA